THEYPTTVSGKTPRGFPGLHHRAAQDARVSRRIRSARDADPARDAWTSARLLDKSGRAAEPVHPFVGIRRSGRLRTSLPRTGYASGFSGLSEGIWPSDHGTKDPADSRRQAGGCRGVRRCLRSLLLVAERHENNKSPGRPLTTRRGASD